MRKLIALAAIAFSLAAATGLNVTFFGHPGPPHGSNNGRGLSDGH